MVEAHGTEKFSCNICGNYFSSKYALNAHIKYTHEARKDHICEYCGKTVSTRSYLKRHELWCQRIERYSCPKCGKKFVTAYALKTHEIVHQEYFSYHCSVCEKSFSREDNLKIHMRIHTGENPFACQHCDKKFRVKCSLQAHEASVHGLKTVSHTTKKKVDIRRRGLS